MTNKRPDVSYNLCTFKFANGKFCTMPAHPKYEGLCLNHATIHRRTYHREDDLVKELASPAGDFITQIDINHVLGKLFEALAVNRLVPLTGAYNLARSVPYRVPLSVTAARRVFRLPYAEPYFAALALKLAAFAVTVPVFVHLTVRARRLTSADGGR